MTRPDAPHPNQGRGGGHINRSARRAQGPERRAAKRTRVGEQHSTTTTKAAHHDTDAPTLDARRGDAIHSRPELQGTSKPAGDNVQGVQGRPLSGRCRDGANRLSVGRGSRAAVQREMDRPCASDAARLSGPVGRFSSYVALPPAFAVPLSQVIPDPSATSSSKEDRRDRCWRRHSSPGVCTSRRAVSRPRDRLKAKVRTTRTRMRARGLTVSSRWQTRAMSAEDASQPTQCASAMPRS